MRADTWLALGVVLAAAAYLVRRAVLRSRAARAAGPGCDRCGH
ncbi:MAG: hypothetical protein RL340_1036 [Gemmatimonadota bacterium]|jgi:hypothetical protein